MSSRGRLPRATGIAIATTIVNRHELSQLAPQELVDLEGLAGICRELRR